MWIELCDARQSDIGSRELATNRGSESCCDNRSTAGQYRDQCKPEGYVYAGVDGRQSKLREEGYGTHQFLGFP